MDRSRTKPPVPERFIARYGQPPWHVFVDVVVGTVSHLCMNCRIGNPQSGIAASPVIIQQNGVKLFISLSRLHQQAVQSNMVYQLLSLLTEHSPAYFTAIFTLRMNTHPKPSVVIFAKDVH